MTKQERQPLRLTLLRSNRHGQSTVNDPVCDIGHLDHMDVAALALAYNSPPVSHIAREDLLEEARMALMKYELAEDELGIAADSLARSMHMLLEQHGLKKLEPERMAELERDVLDYYGLCSPTAAAK